MFRAKNFRALVLRVRLLMAGSVVDDLAAKLSLDSPSVSWESKVNILKNKHATEEECLEAVVFFRKLLSGGKNLLSFNFFG